MKTYYNEMDSSCCAWLSNLMDAGHISPGRIDDRSIENVSPTDIKGFEHAHFFTGIGGWELAFRLAGYQLPGTWTGSCPCQPFSTAGRRAGTDDSRHLWPVWFRLIRECRPQRVFGEQVASAIEYGWFDGVSTDLEAEDYAVGAVVLGAHSSGAPHQRQRLFWVGNANGQRLERRGIELGKHTGELSAWAAGVDVQCPDGKTRILEPGIQPLAHGVLARVAKLRGLGNAIVPQVAAEFIESAMGG